MYALTADDLRAIAELVEKLNNGILGVDGMYIGAVPIRDSDGVTVIGVIEYDDHGVYGFNYLGSKSEDKNEQ